MDCKVCDNTGFVEIDEVNAVPCSKCYTQRLFINRCNLANIDAKWRGATLPLSTEYNLKGLVGFTAEEQKEAKDVNELLSYLQKTLATETKGLFLYGNTGRGKTYAAYAMLMHHLLQGKTVFSIKEEELLEQAFGIPSDEEAADRHIWISEMISSADILLIDEVGASPMDSKNYKKNFFNELIRTRADKGHATVMTSNLTPTQLGDRNGRRTFSFIKEICFCVEFQSDADFRDSIQKGMMTSIEGLLK